MNRSRRIVRLGAALAALTACCALGPNAQAAGHDADAEELGWRLGVQAYSFKNFTFFEAIDKAAAAGLGYIEAYTKQKISAGSDETTHFTMGAATRKKVLAKLETSGVKLVAYGVVKGKNEAEWRQIFEFAKAMGIESITTEPKFEELDLVEKLCDEFDIRAALHNHPSPSPYWSPEILLAQLEGRSKRIGACADTGHWMRSGLDPVECLRKLEGRIISLHFKDLDHFESQDTPRGDRTAHDMIWGQGAGNAFGMLEELKRQKFQGLISAEYEYNWDHSDKDIARCAAYFNLAASALNSTGYKPLFNKDLSNATFNQGSWELRGGVLAALDKGDIWTKATYGDFALDLEFKCAEDTNSGVFIRCADIEKWLHTGIEVQIQQPVHENRKHNSGAIFDVLAPTKQTIRPAGAWNHYTIFAKDNQIHVALNGAQVLNMDLDQWTEAHKNPDGTKNKFNTAYKNMPREGHIGLQYHGHPVWFRNLKIKAIH